MDQNVRAARRVGTQGQCTCSAFAVCVAFDVASLEIKILAPKNAHRRRWPAAVPPKPGGRGTHFDHVVREAYDERRKHARAEELLARLLVPHLRRTACLHAARRCAPVVACILCAHLLRVACPMLGVALAHSPNNHKRGQPCARAALRRRPNRKAGTAHTVNLRMR